MAIDLKIFDHLAENDGKALSTAELARQAKAEDALISTHCACLENAKAIGN